MIQLRLRGSTNIKAALTPLVRLFFSIAMVALTLLTAKEVQAREGDSLVPRWGVGFFGGAWLSSAFEGLSEAPRPIGVEKKTIAGWRAETHVALPLWAGSGIYGSLGASHFSGSFSDRENVVIGVGGQPTPAVIEHSLRLSYYRADVEGGFFYSVLPHLEMGLGLRLATVFALEAAQEQALISPPGFSFVRPPAPYNGRPASHRTFLPEISLRLAYSIPLNSNGLALRPQIMYSHLLSSPLSAGAWQLSSLFAGINLDIPLRSAARDYTPAPTALRSPARDTIVIRDTVLTTSLRYSRDTLRLDTSAATEHYSQDSSYITVIVREKYIKTLYQGSPLLQVALSATLPPEYLSAAEKPLSRVPKAALTVLDGIDGTVLRSDTILLLPLSRLLITTSIIHEEELTGWSIASRRLVPAPLTRKDSAPPDSFALEPLFFFVEDHTATVQDSLSLTVVDYSGQKVTSKPSTLTMQMSPFSPTAPASLRSFWLVPLPHGDIATTAIEAATATLDVSSIIGVFAVGLDALPRTLFSLPVQPAFIMLPPSLKTLLKDNTTFLLIETR